MPMPSSKPTGGVPEKFDPVKHCGALIRIDREDDSDESPTTVCLRWAGRLNGRCTNHGGATVGPNSSTSGGSGTPIIRETLLARAKAIRNSDDLLTLDNEIAVVKAIIEQKFRMYDDLYVAANTIMDRIAAGDPGLENEFPALTPNDIDGMIDLKELDTLNRLIKTAYDMKFSKRFSVPITELESIMNQVAEAFREAVQRFGIPETAVLFFANRLGNLRLSRPVDYQLDRAGGLPVPMLVEGEYSEYSDNSTKLALRPDRGTTKNGRGK